MNRIAAILLAVVAGLVPAGAQQHGFESLEQGIELGRFPACMKSSRGDSLITVVRVDTARFEPKLVAASNTESRKRHTVKTWARSAGLVVATNAGMYHPDLLKHVGYMVDHSHLNNPVPVKSYKSVLAIDPKTKDLPFFQLADLEETTLESLMNDYHVLIQNLRMISHRKTNVWAPSDKKWSTAALATDGAGRLLFVFSRSPFSVHDLNDCLLKLPIDIARAQYLEGGPEACLYIAAGGREILLAGSFEDDTDPDDGGGIAWPIPNVIGVSRRHAPPPVSDR